MKTILKLNTTKLKKDATLNFTTFVVSWKKATNTTKEVIYEHLSAMNYNHILVHWWKYVVRKASFILNENEQETYIKGFRDYSGTNCGKIKTFEYFPVTVSSLEIYVAKNI